MLPQILLITGQGGVGKQRLALWIAQRLFCQNPGGEPCGICPPCRKVLGLGHPDLHWFMPLPRPKASEQDKQVEELEEALGEVLATRRNTPLYGPPDGLSGHFVSTARLLARKAALRPADGNARVFIIGRAERLVPQESSPEAANALLKLLEEPPTGSWFILTTADPDGVLPTIRSRAVQLRVPRLTDEEVSRFLHQYAGVSGTELASRTSKAEGSIGMALFENANSVKDSRLASVILESARAKSQEGWEIAIKQMPFSARGEFTGTLDALADMLSRASRGGKDNRELDRLASLPRTKLVAALDRVGEARELAQNNVNPQILLAVLTQELMEIL